MKKTVNKLFCVLLSAVMLLTLLPAFTALAGTAPSYAVGDHIEFGSYPQTRVEETGELAAAADAAQWRSYGYYSGGDWWCDGQMTPGDWMRFADFFCGGEKYRAVIFTQYRPYETGETPYTTESSNAQYKNGYTSGTVYYFRYEPLNWRVLDPETHLVMCESIVDAQAFQNVLWEKYISYLEREYYKDGAFTVYANDYEASSIRFWLNHDFYYTAFTGTQRAKIMTTQLDYGEPEYLSEQIGAYSETDDRIFLLSYAEVTNTDYGFTLSDSYCYPPRLALSTDYAKCQALNVYVGDNLDGYSEFYLRTPGGTHLALTSEAFCPTRDGYESRRVSSLKGVRPACRLSSMVPDGGVSEELFSAHEHDPANPVEENFVEPTCTEIGSMDQVTYCAICGDEISRETFVLDRYWHDYVLASSYAPSCASSGLNEYVCSRCGDVYTEDIPQIPHDFRTISAVEATCTEEGCTEYTVCNICAIWGVAPQAIPALGHAWGEWFTVTPATAEAEGLEKRVCGRNASHVETRAIPALTDEDIVASGYCGGEGDGTNLRWNLTRAGVLTISGAGLMHDGECFDDTVKANTVSVVIEPGATNVGSHAFMDFSSLSSVSLPDTLVTIDDHAFARCALLADVTIPVGVASLGDMAFYMCESLTEIVIPDSVTRMDNSAFCLCKGLTSVTVPGGIRELATTVFSGCSALESVMIEDGVEKIGRSAFSYCTSLSEITIPQSVTEIGISAFAYCSALSGIALPDGITQIAGSAFYYCMELTSVEIPDAVTSIGSFAFFKCDRLGSVRVPQNVTEIGGQAFSHCGSLTEIALPAGLESVGAQAFDCCGELIYVFFAGSEAQWAQIAVEAGNEQLLDAFIHYNATGHTAGNSVVENMVLPTCTEGGVSDVVSYCVVCGKELEREQWTNGAFGHLWGEWTVLTPPTADGEGLMERRCLRDGTHVETAAIPAGEFGEHELLRGYCGGEGDGKNLIWTLTDDDKIIICGTGRMRDYGNYTDLQGDHDYLWSNGQTYEQVRGPQVPWPRNSDYEERYLASLGIATEADYIMAIVNGELSLPVLYDLMAGEYEGHPYTVVVEEGVTHVGANAFAETRVTALELPSTLEWIGMYAFANLRCDTLVLPEGVRFVDPCAFIGGSYTSVTIPSTVEVVGQQAIENWGADSDLREITVLCPDDRLNSVLSGILPVAYPSGLPMFSYEDYSAIKEIEDLSSDYFFLYGIDSSVSEEIEMIAAGYQLDLTDEQKQNVRNLLVDSCLFELRHDYGADVGTPEEGMAFICGRVNELIGASFTADELFAFAPDCNFNSLSSGDLFLTPAADAVYAARFGCGFSETFFKFNSGHSIKALKYEDTPFVLPQWLTLRGHCGSQLQSDYEDLVTFEAVEHDLALGEVTAEPICTTPGERSVTCPVCGETFTEEIPALGGHSFTSTVTTPPTCTEPGVRTYECERCHETYTEEEPASGHGLLGYNVSSAPSTCVVRGYSMTVCIACGEITDYEVYNIDPDNHNWGEWTLVTPPTYLSEGLEQRVCGWCGETQTHVLPALIPEVTIGDPDTGIELQLQQGVLPENTVFEVDEEFDGTYFMLLNREVGNVGSTLYNITPTSDGQKVQPDGYVLVRLPIPAGYNPDTLCIYYISTETSSTERMDCYIEDGYICFQTTHFSVYAIVDTSAVTQTQEDPAPGGQSGNKLSFFARLTEFFRKIADWFKKLFTK